ncbi:hypothetical protein [Bradyrhizobium sp. 5.13L]
MNYAASPGFLNKTLLCFSSVSSREENAVPFQELRLCDNSARLTREPLRAIGGGVPLKPERKSIVACNDGLNHMNKEASETSKDSNVDNEKATEDLKQVVSESIEEQRALIEKLRRKLN